MRENATDESNSSQIKRGVWIAALLAILIFLLPIEYKYDKWLRHFSLTLIPSEAILPPAFQKKICFYISDILTFLLLSLTLAALPLRRLLLEKSTLFLGLFFLCALMSVWNSPLSNYPVIYAHLLQLLTPILLCALVSLIPFSRQTIRYLLAIFILAALFQSLFAILQYFSQAPLGFSWFGEPKQATGLFTIAEGKRWLFDNFFSYKASHFVMRASGTMTHCNVLGGFLALAMLASYSWIVSTSKIWLRNLLGFSLIIQFFACSITYSRSALFGLIVGTFLWFTWAFVHRGFFQTINDRAYRFLTIMILLSIATSATLLSQQYLKRGGIINYNHLAQTSDLIRFETQNVAFQIIREKPLLGAGYLQFKNDAKKHLSPKAPPTETHNIYLLIASEMGLLALLSFLGFIASVLYTARKLPFTPERASLLAIFILFLFVGGCDLYPIFCQQGRLMLFLSAGLLIASTRYSETETLISNKGIS